MRGQFGGQYVFSFNSSVFDIRLEGVIVFDRGDGLLRNEIASHIYYDNEIGWTNAALYFYHGHPKNGEREVYEYDE